MILSEAAALLTMCAAFDQRTIGLTDAQAWHETLSDVDVADARAAVVEYYKSHRERIMPMDVRQAVARVREARIAAAPPVQPPPGLDEQSYLLWWRQTLRAAGDGTLQPDRLALGAVPEEAKRLIAEAMPDWSIERTARTKADAAAGGNPTEDSG